MRWCPVCSQKRSEEEASPALVFDDEEERKSGPNPLSSAAPKTKVKKSRDDVLKECQEELVALENQVIYIDGYQNCMENPN